MQCEVIVAVRPSLPVPGVDVILGNLLTKNCVWSNCPAPPAVATGAVKPAEQYECAAQFPGVFTACAVTRARTVDVSGGLSGTKCFFPVLPSAFNRNDFISAQKADESLSALLAESLPENKWSSAERSYFMCAGLLVHKFTVYFDELSETLSQIVVPKVFRDQVLKTAHGDGGGHFGVRKTYNRLLQHFY